MSNDGGNVHDIATEAPALRISGNSWFSLDCEKQAAAGRTAALGKPHCSDILLGEGPLRAAHVGGVIPPKISGVQK